MELSARRYFLESLLQTRKAPFGCDGREIFGAACEHGLEGIIAKNNESTYVGSVWTSFNERSAEYLRKTLDRIKRKTPAC
jgi:bifunctional non-homologous end joining protein LigD